MTHAKTLELFNTTTQPTKKKQNISKPSYKLLGVYIYFHFHPWVSNKQR